MVVMVCVMELVIVHTVNSSFLKCDFVGENGIEKGMKVTFDTSYRYNLRINKTSSLASYLPLYTMYH